MNPLLTPMTIGKVAIKNRFVMAPMGTCLANENGAVTKKLIDYYLRRVRGGVGAIIIENTAVDQVRQTCRLSIENHHLTKGLRELVEQVQAVDGEVRLFLQLVAQTEGHVPDPYRATQSDESVQSLTPQQIQVMVERFVVGAQRAQAIGFDGIEVHGGHHHAISQFLSPHYNKRTDHYGGDFDRRLNFALEVIRGIRAKVRPDFPMVFRLNGADFVQDGLQIQDACRIAQRLAEAGVDAFDVSAAVGTSAEWQIQPMGIPAGCLVPLAQQMKKAVSVPVIAVGKINTPELARRIVEEDKADFVALGRALLADPDFPLKVAENRPSDIRKCLACLYCMSERVHRGFEIRCKGNYSVGRELLAEILSARTRSPKKVMIVGSGPAGLECARILKERGHDVRLYEKGPRLGGQLITANASPRKVEIAHIRDFLTSQVAKLGVTVALGQTVTLETVRQERPDILVLATGAEPAIPAALMSAKGSPGVATFRDVLSGERSCAGHVTIIGGGITGCEVAEYLYDRHPGCSVTIVEMLSQVAREETALARKVLLKRLEELGACLKTDTKVLEVTEGQVVIEEHGQRTVLKTDLVVFATGLAPNTVLSAELRQVGIPFYQIGDCTQVKTIAEAIDAAWSVNFEENRELLRLM
jgi:2,4-dienoyl-CoA reductase-like NADH-dependent reductase (Old Yellow Enzyme family)/NADH dehydrogenase FAD-containing subunit